MSDRPGDDDEQSASDWLAAQFEQTAEVPRSQVPPPAAPVPPPLVEPPAALPTPAWTPPAPAASGAAPIGAAPVGEPAPTAAWTRPPVDPPVQSPPDAAVAPSWEQPTQAMPAVPAEAPPPAPAPLPQPPLAPPPPYGDLAATELLQGAATIGHDAGTTSALDALFGEQNFQDYGAEPLVPVLPAPRDASVPAAAPRPAGVSRTQTVLLSVAGGLVAILALVALFLLGTRLASLIEPAPVVAPSASPSPSPSPSATVEPVGPVDPGVWAWDELLGGECLDPFADPWAEEFTVVACTLPHPAQLVYRGVIPPPEEGATDEPFPGVDALQTQLSTLCTAKGVVDLAAAKKYTDVQVQGAYPATQEQWDAGERHYFCFATRSSGEPFGASIALPPPAPED